ncbi:putative lipid II flippase FtsW [Galbitalea sp. SE-J8]|uniref:putative lipid II flippase FtsW n=1 Tax=Galbitalea sp. SE-J8 TaxID=3054952 RepID=UPI00259CE835|nr:putative lipid II flippase FtsW [Galbitalea sp. SE-J8]MDM4763085.1 putative lipid II flippase FtsW [Galbitalea sp. SE-J8]
MTSTVRAPGMRRPSTQPPPRRTAPARAAAGAADGSRAVVAVRRVFASEGRDYFLLLGVTLFLVIFGLVMVLSSSSVESYAKTDNAFAFFLRQGMFALVGVPAMLLAGALPLRFWATWAGRAMLIGVALQLLVFTPLGDDAGGNRNWISVGGFTAQPSEFIKVGLCLWLAWILTRKAELIGDWRHLLLPIGPVAGLAIALVLAGADLGTALILLMIVFGAMYFAGVKLRYLLTSGVLVAIGASLLALSGGSRVRRISWWISGCTVQDYDQRECWQPLHGTWALAAGGPFGVGLGNSKSKWSWLPAADNDYIFSIIGEELGLVGAVVVLLLFVVLAIAMLRIMRDTVEPFPRLVVGGVMTWIIGQALVNIAVVLGLLPVLGVPLPLISAGGSSLVMVLVAIGIVLSVARDNKRREIGLA